MCINIVNIGDVFPPVTWGRIYLYCGLLTIIVPLLFRRYAIATLEQYLSVNVSVYKVKRLK